MDMKELRERRIYAPFLCAAVGENGEGQDVLARFEKAANWSGGRISNRDKLLYMSRFVNEQQHSIVCGLEHLNFESSEIRWGDFILPWRYWHHVQLFVVVRLGYEHLDVVLNHVGQIHAVTEIGKAAESVNRQAGPGYGWPYAHAFDVPLLAGFQLKPGFLQWQQRAIENIWNSPRNHCHRCGARTVHMSCDHRKSIMDAITGENNYEYSSEST